MYMVNKDEYISESISLTSHERPTYPSGQEHCSTMLATVWLMGRGDAVSIDRALSIAVDMSA